MQLMIGTAKKMQQVGGKTSHKYPTKRVRTNTGTIAIFI